MNVLRASNLCFRKTRDSGIITGSSSKETHFSRVHKFIKASLTLGHVAISRVQFLRSYKQNLNAQNPLQCVYLDETWSTCLFRILTTTSPLNLIPPNTIIHNNTISYITYY
jgi:hypothetical protein